MRASEGELGERAREVIGKSNCFRVRERGWGRGGVTGSAYCLGYLLRALINGKVIKKFFAREWKEDWTRLRDQGIVFLAGRIRETLSL